jgi:hypothetical protein
MSTSVTLSPAHDGKHKLVAHVREDGKERTVRFGAAGMSDYTQHHDKARRARYLARHQKRENWSRSGRLTPGFFSKHLLWGPTTSLDRNLRIMRRKYFTQARRTR